MDPIIAISNINPEIRNMKLYFVYSTLPKISTIVKLLFSKTQFVHKACVSWNSILISKLVSTIAINWNIKLKKRIKPIGAVDQLIDLKAIAFIFNIIITKRNKTAIAPTYTMSNIKARNSAPKSRSKPTILQNTIIKNNTEWTAFERPITMIAETKEKLENK
jgi:hypothetical protein